MNIAEQATVLAHTQVTARHFLAYRGSLEKLVELIRYSIGAGAPPAESISSYLRRDETQKLLELEHETAIFQSADRSKSWRLISLAIQADPEVAARRLAKKPPSSDCCAFCWQDERGWTTELQPERDVYGEIVGGVYLHRPCARAYARLRDLVARSTKC
jgi:hypothetical protein